MSKQSEAKTRQGYVPKATPRTCVNCVHFKMDSEVQTTEYGASWTVDKNLRCTLGGFAVKKMGTCLEFVMTALEAAERGES